MFDTHRFTEEIRHLSLRALRELATSVISNHFQRYRASELMVPWSLLFEECERRSPTKMKRLDEASHDGYHGFWTLHELTGLWSVCMRAGRVKSQAYRGTVDLFLSDWSKTKETVQ